MDLQVYEKASDIRIQISHMNDILCVLKNSRGNSLCATKLVREDDYTSSSSPSIINWVHIMDEPILGKLTRVVEEEIRLLEEEFRAL